MAKYQINVGINSPFDLGNFNQNKSDKEKKALEKMGNYLLLRSDLENEEKCDVVIVDSNLSKQGFKTKDNDEIVVNVFKKDGESTIHTGKYIGCLIINGITLMINSGYASFFTQRLLNFSNNIFLDNSAKYDSGDSINELSILIQYLFLSNLKKAAIVGLTRKYVTTKENGFKIKGNISIYDYIKHIKNNYKGIDYVFRSREYSQEILDTIYNAFCLCDKSYVNNSFRELLTLFKEMKQYASKGVISPLTINKAKKSQLLNNEIYSQYKKVLLFAEMIICHKGFTPDIDNKNKQLVRGWLIDIADLWELYLFKIIKHKFDDWNVFYQEEIPIYENLFFSRSFMPDIVMKKDNKIVILDAKFKKMDFRNQDVDREDIQQIHTYYCYYKEKGYDVVFTSLVYPSRYDAPNNSNCIGGIFDCGNSKFGISYLKVGSNSNEQMLNEIEFINKLKNELAS